MPTIITNANVSFTTTFKLDTTPKKINLTDTIDYAGNAIPTTGARGVMKIVSPSGVTVYNNTNYAAPDVTVNVSTTNSTTIPLPYLSNGSPEQGNYDITYTVRIIDGVNPTYYITRTISYDFEYASPTVSITAQADCISPLFTTADVTDYVVGGITPTNTRTITLEFPSGSGGTPIANTSSAVITTSTFYNGMQVTTVASDLSYVFDDDLVVEDTVQGTKTIVVDCSFICQLYCCLRALRNNVEANRNVDDVMFKYYTNLFNQAMNELELLFLAIDCGKQVDANTYIANIKLISNCQDDCSCTDGTPSRVTGLGLQNVNVAVNSCGSPIIVTSVVAGGITTYTICFDPALVTLINNAYNTVVQNTDGTITVVPSGVIAGVQTYTISANYVVQNELDFRCRLQYTNPAVPDVTITNSDYQFSGTNMIGTATVASVGYGGPNWANKNNLFKVSTFQVANTNTYKVDVRESIQAVSIVIGPVTLVYSGTGINALGIDVDVQVINETTGEFYFQFCGKNRVPLTNKQMTFSTDIIVNISIAQ